MKEGCCIICSCLSRDGGRCLSSFCRGFGGDSGIWGICLLVVLRLVPLFGPSRPVEAFS